MKPAAIAGAAIPAPAMNLRRELTGNRGSRKPEDNESPMAVKLNPRSRTDSKRSSRFFSRQRRTMKASAGGSAGPKRLSKGDGSTCKTMFIVSIGEGPRNARLPVSIS